tara:strand:- start:707 stop:1063 length:357 start_codon:yes stop_codon:yes gene_type:complete
LFKFTYDTWNLVMNHQRNPLRHIDDLQTRHVVMQLLAWMWCIIFSMSVGSITVFGITTVAHILLIAGIVTTVGVFETAQRNPKFFDRFPTSTPSRSRNMYYNGKKIQLDPNDKGGEHE